MSLLSKYYLNQLSQTDLSDAAKIASGDTRKAATPTPSADEMLAETAGKAAKGAAQETKSKTSDAIAKIMERRERNKARDAYGDSGVARVMDAE